MIDDLDLVRTFLAVLESGSFSAAAPGVYRTQAAVSQQIRRLEQQVGETLFVRSSRELRLTPAGERFAPHARRLLRASAEARLAARGDHRRLLRLGIADDLAATVVIPALGRLGGQAAGLAFDITVGATHALYAALATRLDVVVGLQLPGRGGSELARLPLGWFGHWTGEGALPLALCVEGCLLRERALAILDRTAMVWEPVIAATGMTVVEAALRAGIAVGPLIEATVSDLPRTPGLPPLGDMGVWLYAHEGMDAAMLELLARAIRAQLAVPAGA